MLVSGGKVIAIDSIKKGNTNKDTLSGDGVWTNLGVNTDVIATTKKLNDTKSELESKINSASSALSGEIKKKQDELKFELNDYNKITAIGPKNGTTTALAGGSNVVVSAGANTRVDTSSAGEQTIYTVNVTANPTNVTVSGENGLTARRDNNTSAYYLGLSSDYIKAITSVSSKLPITAFTTYSAAHKNDDVTPYTAGNYIEITNHKIIGHDWTNTIKSASSNAVTTVRNTFNGDGSTYSGYNGIPFIDNKTPKWSVVGDGNRISVTSANNKYGVSWNSAGYATEEWVLGKNYLPKDVASSTYLTIASANEIYQKKLHAGAGIVIKNETDISVDISVSGDIIPYSAGEGIGIDNHIVSITADYLSANALKDLSGRWESAANALEASADNWNKTYKDVSDSAKYWNSAYDALASADKWNTTYERVELSGDEWDKVSAKLDSATFKTYSALMEQKLIDLDDKNLDVSSFSSVSSDFALKTEVQEEFEQTSAWVKDNFLSANALDNLSGNWESTYKTVETNSGKWETAYETLTSNSADWDEVSAKLNSATFATYSADIKSTIETFSGEFVELSGDFTAHSADSNLHLSAGERVKWTYAANRVENSAAIWDTVSAKVNKTDFEEFKTSAHNELEKKLDKDEFESWSANKDYDFYSAGNGIKIENHIVSVSADYALSADVYNKDEVDELIANFGGYTTATSAEPDGHPDVREIDPRRIYLVKMASGPTSADNYKEWIYIDTASAWNCVGETTMDLTPYLTKEEAANTYQPIDDYVVSSTDVIKPGSAWVLVNDNDNVQWSGLDVSELGKTYVVKSTNGTIGVGSATIGNVITYDLSGAKIVGENGVSAEYNPATNEWNVGLEDYNDIGFAKYSSSANVYTASAVVDGYTEDLNVNPTKITLDNYKILLKTGFYHVDVQTNFTIANPDNNYYNVFVKSIPNAASITQMIDGSYAHTETVDLSFDIRITNDNTPLEISVENFKTNETFAISNLNIHEIVSMPSQIEGGAGNYQAGNGISIGNDTIAAKIGNGLEFNESNAIQVKLGKGLKFDDSQGVQAVTIDSDVNEVVETVQELQESLDTKITDNYPPAMITIADLQVANQTQYAPSNGGMLIGYLFTCPITHKIYTGSNNDYKTKIGIYTKQWSGDNKKVILGIYEYQPDYVNPDTLQVGKTEALCDTGIIELQQGYAEYDVKNLGSKTSHEMKPGCFYYATIYLSYKAGDTNGITLFGAPGYNTQVNNLKPGITITNVNCIHASLYEGLDGYSPDLNFDQMGFSWQYNSYPPSSTSDPYTSQGIVEAHAAGRPYFAIRNVKIVTGN